MLESLDLPFVQRGLAEVLLLSAGAGLIGTWIVLRGLAFFSHAVGTAAFPGLVLADGLGFAAPLGALGAGAVFALLVLALPREREDDRGAHVALALVGMLALGVILASDVFDSSAGIDSLLFGSLLLIDPGDLVLAAGVSVATVAAAALAGRHWVAAGFDAGGDAAVPRHPGLEGLLLLLVALSVAAALGAVGALLVASIFVVPAATTRPWCSRMRTWQAATVALCAAIGCAGVVLSVELNAPPGATIAVLAGAVFAASALVRRAGAGRLRRVAVAARASLASLIAAGCGDTGPDDAPVVATTPLVADLAASVAGDDREVRSLMSPGTDPHDYEPRPADVAALADAELVVAGGGDLDAWIADAMDDSGSDAELLVLGEGVPHPVEGDEGIDPHWWHDPRNAEAAAEAIAERLEALFPGDAATVRRRARDYVALIASLDRRLARCVASIPAGERKLVTDHDAFAYLGERYGIDVVGAVIPALTTQAQPSAGELADLRETIEREGVRGVFPEASVPPELAERVAAETGATADYELYGDTLGPEGSAGSSYAGMLAANAEALTRGMTGGERGCPAEASAAA